MFLKVFGPLYNESGHDTRRQPYKVPLCTISKYPKNPIKHELKSFLLLNLVLIVTWAFHLFPFPFYPTLTYSIFNFLCVLFLSLHCVTYEYISLCPRASKTYNTLWFITLSLRHKFSNQLLLLKICFIPLPVFSNSHWS